MIGMSYGVQHKFSASQPLDAGRVSEKHKKDQSDLRVGKDRPTLKLWCSDHDWFHEILIQSKEEYIKSYMCVGS